MLLYQGWTYWVFRKRIGTQHIAASAGTERAMFHVKPIDPRLLRYARATRLFLLASVALGLAGAGLVVAQAMLIADVVVGAFQHGRGGELRTPLLLLGGRRRSAGRWSPG